MNIKDRAKRRAEFLKRIAFVSLLGLSANAVASSGDAAFVGGNYSVNPNSSGSSATFNVAGIKNTTTNTTTGSLGFELWYLPSPYSGGEITGYKVAENYLPIANCTNATLTPGESCDNIVVTDSLTLPPNGTYYPYLFLVEYSSSCSTNGGFCYDDQVQLMNLATGGPTVTVQSGGGSGSSSGGGGSGSSGGQTGGGVSGGAGNVEYQSGAQVSVTNINWSTGTVGELDISGVTNPTNNTSGSIEFQLWLSSTPYSQGAAYNGYKIASLRLPDVCATAPGSAQMPPQHNCNTINGENLPILSTPPAGTYYATIFIEEFSSSCPANDGYCIDQGTNLNNPIPGPAAVAPPPASGLTGDGSGGGGGSFEGITIAGLLMLFAFKGRRRYFAGGHFKL